MDEVANVSIRRVLGTLVHHRPLRRDELPPPETAQKPVKDLHLALIEHGGGMGLPETGLCQDGCQGILSALDGAR